MLATRHSSPPPSFSDGPVEVQKRKMTDPLYWNRPVDHCSAYVTEKFGCTSSSSTGCLIQTHVTVHVLTRSRLDQHCCRTEGISTQWTLGVAVVIAVVAAMIRYGRLESPSHVRRGSYHLRFEPGHPNGARQDGTCHPQLQCVPTMLPQPPSMRVFGVEHCARRSKRIASVDVVIGIGRIRW